MPDIDRLEREVAIAQRAKAIYEDDLFVSAVEAIKDDIWTRFRQTAVADDRTRLELRLQLDCLERICQRFKNHMQTGKLATQELSMIEKMKAKLKGVA